MPDISTLLSLRLHISLALYAQTWPQEGGVRRAIQATFSDKEIFLKLTYLCPAPLKDCDTKILDFAKDCRASL